MSFIIQIIDFETGETSYVTRGEYSLYGTSPNLSQAKFFDDVHSAKEALDTDDFTKFNGVSPPLIPWRGLGICNSKPSGHGAYRIIEVSLTTQVEIPIEYAQARLGDTMS